MQQQSSSSPPARRSNSSYAATLNPPLGARSAHDFALPSFARKNLLLFHSLSRSPALWSFPTHFWCTTVFINKHTRQTVAVAGRQTGTSFFFFLPLGLYPLCHLCSAVSTTRNKDRTRKEDRGSKIEKGRGRKRRRIGCYREFKVFSETVGEELVLVVSALLLLCVEKKKRRKTRCRGKVQLVVRNLCCCCRSLSVCRSVRRWLAEWSVFFFRFPVSVKVLRHQHTHFVSLALLPPIFSSSRAAQQ